MVDDDEFQPVAHSGGKQIFQIKVKDGRVLCSIRYTVKAVGQTAICAIYTLVPQGIPIGINDFSNQAADVPCEGCIPIFFGSDREGLFGRKCPTCDQYFRTQSTPSERRRLTVCAYCGITAPAHLFLTEEHLDYIKHAANMYIKAVEKRSDVVVDMDIGVEQAKNCPQSYYYNEVRQQNKFKCASCGIVTDVFGQYAFCPYCGRRNALSVLEKRLLTLEQRIDNPRFDKSDREDREAEWRDIVRQCVSSFEGYTKDIVKCCLKLHMANLRRKELKAINYHWPLEVASVLEKALGINMLENVTAQEREFLRLRFLRRHIYEHNSGVADEEYVKKSGDKVQVGHIVRERSSNLKTLIGIIRKIAINLDEDFHSIILNSEN